jgi:hypothetical protein
MRDFTAGISEKIAQAEKRLDLDWRTSWSRVVSDTGGTIHVTVSRPEIFEELSPQDGVIVELAGSSPAGVLWSLSSVVDLRREPEHSSELLTQAIMGETMKRAGAMVGAGVTYVLSEPKAGSLPVSDITAGTKVVTGETTGDYIQVELPGGRSGFLETGSLEDLPAGTPAGKDLIERARRFLGIPYIWGGTSAKGFDCSGLVKRVFRMEGMETPRDADQQSVTGSPVDEESPREIPEGTLLFFGEGNRVTHVAISLGGGMFIHSYGDVRVNSLLENDPEYEENLARIYLFSRDLLADPSV